jgi:hypothetical protein
MRRPSRPKREGKRNWPRAESEKPTTEGRQRGNLGKTPDLRADDAARGKHPQRVAIDRLARQERSFTDERSKMNLVKLPGSADLSVTPRPVFIKL